MQSVNDLLMSESTLNETVVLDLKLSIGPFIGKGKGTKHDEDSSFSRSTQMDHLSQEMRTAKIMFAAHWT